MHASSPATEQLLYARGFVVARAPLQATPARFLRVSLDADWHLAHDPALDVAVSTGRAGHWVTFAGFGIDVVTGCNGAASLSAALLASLSASETAFFDALDNISGRFIVIFSDMRTIRLLHDACGLRSVFYSWNRDTVVASHARLVAEATETGASPLQLLTQSNRAVRYKFGYPGLETPFAGVRTLTPNSLLDLTNKKIQRYFPRTPLRQHSLSAAIELSSDMMRRQLQVLAQNVQKRTLVSLTAGMDSRLTLALSRPHWPGLSFFTYQRHNNTKDVVDVALASLIAKRLGLKHEVITTTEVEDTAPYHQFEAVLKKNTFYHHGWAVAYLYWQTFGSCNPMHVRSNLGEIGRAFYFQKYRIRWMADLYRAPIAYLGKRMARARRFGPQEMVRLYAPGMATQPLVNKAFADFHELSEFEKRLNYDPYDLFYWEHRMGTWHSQVVLESDPAFETHVIFNARSILNAMLALPLAARREGIFFQEIIRRNLPELSGLPINPVYGLPAMEASSNATAG